MARYAIFGDSYVSRLDKFCLGSLDFPTNCKFFGVPGMSTTNKFRYTFARLLDYRPRYVFLNVGGNDIRDGCDAHEIYLKLIDIVQELYRAGVERVFVASIVARGRFPAWTGLDKKKFTVCRRYINKQLKKYLGRDFIEVGKRLMFTRHYDSDLVHPGVTQGGMKVFMYEVVKAFRRTL